MKRMVFKTLKLGDITQRMGVFREETETWGLEHCTLEGKGRWGQASKGIASYLHYVPTLENRHLCIWKINVLFNVQMVLRAYMDY